MKIALLVPLGILGRMYVEAAFIRYFGFDQVVTFTQKEDVEKIDETYDLVFSYLFPHKIPMSVVNKTTFGGINFHPAPLPKYRGFAVYNFGILNNETEWYATVHKIAEDIDCGDILYKTAKCKIRKDETVTSLRDKTHTIMELSLERILTKITNEFDVFFNEAEKQSDLDEGAYYSKSKMLKESRILPSDDKETVDRKCRAFWCPPHDGAYIEIDGEKFTLINRDILRRL